MAPALNTFLIPIDFSLNTEIAVQKALSLVGSDKAVFHLLHVISRRQSPALIQAENDLQLLGCNIRGTHQGLAIKTHVLAGHSVQQMIIECAKMAAPDMIIIGKQNDRRKWFSQRGISPNVLAQKTNCPVLTAKLGSVGNRTKVIVIPIGDFLPERKLEWAVALAKKYKAQIHLLAMHGQHDDQHLPQVFLDAYHRLREQLHNPIEFFVAARQNPARAALHYAELIMADMVLVNPQAESGIGTFGITRHISDLIERNSKLQVLDVERYKIN